MLQFLKDNTKWVKIAAFKMLGPIIALMKDQKGYEKLLEYYFMMVEP